MSIDDEFPLIENNTATQGADKPITKTVDSDVDSKEYSSMRVMWAQLSEFGLAEPVLRLGTHLSVLTLVLAAIWGLRYFYLNNKQARELDLPQRAAFAASIEGVQQATEPAGPPWR